MGLGEDYVKKLEEQRKLRERILKTKEQRRKQVKVAGGGTDKSSDQSKELSRSEASSNASAAASARKAAILENAREIEADSTVATGKCGKPKKILRIVRDKSGKIISKKVWWYDFIILLLYLSDSFIKYYALTLQTSLLSI